MLVTALQQKPLAIDEASDGSEAITLLGQNRYSVVLLDLLMPNVSGFGVLESIEESAKAPIVLVLSGADRRVLDQLTSTKIHGIVKKPFDPTEIADVVNACAEIRGEC